MNKYELTVILRNTTAESLKEKVKEILEKFQVKILEEDTWGVKKLAYEIDGEREGTYLLFNIEAPTESIDKIISEFRINADILRYLFVKVKSESVV